MHSMLLGDAARMALRMLSSAARLSVSSLARYSSNVRGFRAAPEIGFMAIAPRAAKFRAKFGAARAPRETGHAPAPEPVEAQAETGSFVGCWAASPVSPENPRSLRTTSS